MSEPTERQPPRIVQRLRDQKERHKRRPRAIRGLVIAVGFTLLLGGVAMLVLPGPALAVIPIGLAILALEFEWADQLLERSLEQADKAKQRASETSRFERIVSVAAVALGIAAVVAWAILGDIPLLPV